MLLFFLACEPVEPPLLELAVPEAWAPVFTDHVTSLPHEVPVTAGEVPARAKGKAMVEAVIVEDDDRCAECFVVTEADGTFTVAAGGVAGAMYGLAQLMEWHGWRFSHPFDIDVPEAPALSADAQLGVDFAPEMARRGYHPHTLHPIEAMYDLWGSPDPERAEAMLDWVVRNRGNYVQWPGLDDLVDDPLGRERWQASTVEVLDAAHARGMEVGLGVQLFGSSNLQLAYDLVEDPSTPEADEAAMADRWSIVTEGLPWDEVSLSFGEFFGADPDVFIDRVTRAYDTLQDAAPGTAMNAVIHVGSTDDVKVEYAGETMTYYFLVQYVDRPIEPFVHSVMYYDLFEDAGGAYGLDDFSEHRAFLEAKLAAGEPVTYFPESAYWVAFDDSVPTWMPLYIRSRWTDVDGLAEEGLPLDRHVLFASGWEWGYWQNDAATLRMGYSRPESWEAAVEELFVDPATSTAVKAAIDAETPLITERLAPYLAGRDVAMDLGDTQDIVSQPRRVLFDEVAALDATGRAELRAKAVEGLRTFADGHDAAAAGLGSDRWADEVADGLAVDAARARYVAALYDAVLLAADGADPTAALAEADAQLAAGRAVVDHRHAHLHDPDPERLLKDGSNPTLYDYGYLTNAETLCFWQRERVQVREVLLGESGTDPGCTL